MIYIYFSILNVIICLFKRIEYIDENGILIFNILFPSITLCTLLLLLLLHFFLLLSSLHKFSSSKTFYYTKYDTIHSSFGFHQESVSIHPFIFFCVSHSLAADDLIEFALCNFNLLVMRQNVIFPFQLHPIQNWNEVKKNLSAVQDNLFFVLYLQSCSCRLHVQYQRN